MTGARLLWKIKYFVCSVVFRQSELQVILLQSCINQFMVALATCSFVLRLLKRLSRGMDENYPISFIEPLSITGATLFVCYLNVAWSNFPSWFLLYVTKAERSDLRNMRSVSTTFSCSHLTHKYDTSLSSLTSNIVYKFCSIAWACVERIFFLRPWYAITLSSACLAWKCGAVKRVRHSQ